MFDKPEYKKLLEDNQTIAAETRKMDEERKQLELYNANKKQLLLSKTTLNIVQQNIAQDVPLVEQANHQLNQLTELNGKMLRNAEIIQKIKIEELANPELWKSYIDENPGIPAILNNGMNQDEQTLMDIYNGFIALKGKPRININNNNNNNENAENFGNDSLNDFENSI